MAECAGPLFLGLDLGTSSVRCIAFDQNLIAVSQAGREYPLLYGPQGAIEQDPQLWFEASVDVIRRCLSGVSCRERVTGLSVSAQGISFVPVDEDGRPLRPAISWLDERGGNYLPRVHAVFSPEEIMERTGKPPSGAYTLPKLLWLRENEPECWRRTRRILLPMDFLLGRLTGRYLCDHSMAGGTMYYNIHERAWDLEILRRLDLDPGLFPPICTSGSPAGKLLPPLADQLGLSRDVVVSVGGQDQKCASLAAGLDFRTLTLSLGTAAALQMLLSRPASDADLGIPSFSYLFDGQWVAEGVVSTAGAALQWFVKTLLGDPDYAAIDAALEGRYPSLRREVFLPGLSRLPRESSAGVRSPEPSGVFLGLSLSSDRAEMARAVMEGVAFEAAMLRSAMQAAFPVPPADRLRVFGGGAASPLWCRMLADTTGLAVETLSSHETAAAGAAVLAGMGCGFYTDPFNAASALPPARRYEPDARASSLMSDRLGWYADLKKSLYG